MMSAEMGHEEFRERVAAYVAGGLEGRERAQFEAHVAVCAVCASALEEAVRVDERLARLFGEARPAEGLEDRVVRRLREEGARRRRLTIHPAVWRATSGLAAALVLGAIGYAGHELIEKGKLPGMAGPVAIKDEGKGGQSSATWEKTGKVVNGRAWRAEGKENLFSSGAGEFDGDGITDADFLAQRMVEDTRQRARESEMRAKQPAVTAGGRGDAYGVEVTDLKRSREGLPLEAAYRQDATGKDYKNHYLDLSSAQDQPATAGRATAAGGQAEAQMRWQRGGFGRSGGGGGGFGGGGAETPGNAPPALAAPGGGGGDGTNASTSHLLGGVAAGAAAAPDGAQVADAQPQNAQAVDREGKQVEVRYFKPMTLGYGDETTGGEVKAGLAEVRDLTRAGAEEVEGLKERPLTDALGNKTTGAPKPDELAQASGTAAGTAVGQAQGQQPALTQQPQAPQVQPAPVQSAMANRKIIRNGEMEFEVDGFDSSFVQITKIVGEEGGFVSSTNSEKLPNGKVKGTVVLRVPPERLDTLVLKLRGMGDLKSQRISAQDVTKIYSDLESELKAGRAMEERLLNIIKSGKGEIKDLLEAEKQLGVYREKIEKLEGEIRYYNNLVSLSTLSVTLYERDIKQAAFAAQTEEVGMGIETEDVEKARAEAIKAIEESKGRIIESNLKKYDAGQLGAMVVCEVSPDAAGPLIDRLKQLGRVARLDIERKQTTPTGTTPVAQARLERRDTRFAISIYNLANIAPRQTTNMNMAVANVEEAYRSILEAVRGRNGRIVTSSLNRQRPEQTTATVSFEVPSADADATLLEIRREREVMALTVTENPDTNNVTAAKRGFSVQIQSLATVPSRETEQQVVATRRGVSETFRLMLEELKKAQARILVSQLNQQDQNNVSGQLDFEVERVREAELRQGLSGLADVISRNVQRSSDVENTVDSKVRVQVRLLSIDQLAPRETHTLGVAAEDVPSAFRKLVADVQGMGGRVLSSQLNEQDAQDIHGTVDFDFLREDAAKVDAALAASGAVYTRAVSRSADTQNTVEMKLRMRVTLRDEEQLPPRERVRVMLEATDVDRARGDLIAASDAAGGRTVEDAHAVASNGEVSSHVVIDVPLGKAQEIRQQIKAFGTVRVSETSKDPQAPDGAVGRARLDVTLTSPGLLVGRDEGLAATVKNALSTSLKGLLWSLNFIVIGLLFVGPWALILWLGWRFVRRARATKPFITPAPAA